MKRLLHCFDSIDRDEVHILVNLRCVRLVIVASTFFLKFAIIIITNKISINNLNKLKSQFNEGK